MCLCLCLCLCSYLRLFADTCANISFLHANYTFIVRHVIVSASIFSPSWIFLSVSFYFEIVFGWNRKKKDELFLFPKSIVFLTGGKNNRIQNLKDFFLLSIIFSFFFSFRSLTFTVFAACVNLNSIIRLSVGNLIIKSAAVNLFCYGLREKKPRRFSWLMEEIYWKQSTIRMVTPALWSSASLAFF